MKLKSKVVFILGIFLLVGTMIGSAILINKYLTASADPQLPTAQTNTQSKLPEEHALISYERYRNVPYFFKSGKWHAANPFDYKGAVDVTDDQQMQEEVYDFLSRTLNDPVRLNLYKITTNNLKNKDETEGYNYLLGRLKDTSATSVTSYSYIISENGYYTAEKIRIDPDNYSIDTAGNLVVKNGTVQATNDASVGTASTPSGSDSQGGSVPNDSVGGSSNVSGGGGSVSLPGGISISRPSALTRFFNFEDAYTSIFNLIVAVAGTIFFLLLLYGGFIFLTSMGNEEAATKGKKILFDAVIGITIVVLSWVVGTWLIEQLKLS